MNTVYLILGFGMLMLACHIGMRILYPWLSELPHRTWLVFASACGIAGVIIIAYALVHTFGWVLTGLMTVAHVLIYVKTAQIGADWSTSRLDQTFDYNDNADPLDQAHDH